MVNRLTADNINITQSNHQAIQMAKEICRGFREHDRGNRKKAITHFSFVDKLQFTHLNETEAHQAAVAYVNALFAKDDVEIQYLRNGHLDREGLRNADWSPVKTQFRIRASIVGMGPSYAEYSTEGWRKHKVGDDYWKPLLKAQKYELCAALQDNTYPQKPKDGQSGYGPEPMRYVLAVELHDMHTETHWEQAKDVMIPYFETILGGQSDE